MLVVALSRRCLRRRPICIPHLHPPRLYNNPRSFSITTRTRTIPPSSFCPSSISLTIPTASLLPPSRSFSDAASPRPRVVQREFELTEEEQDLFASLQAVVKEFDLDVTLRVAGGWVRNKLVGGYAGDIDIAVDTMSGLEFAEHLIRFQKQSGEQVIKLGKVRRNPAQSKHLETVVIQLNGRFIDIVNLRNETYTEESRIPTATGFGTPQQDAFRRDFTMNSLFYNLQTDEVEDCTGMGLDDLKAGRLRTPLDAVVIFRDDPLRVLRGVRFAATHKFRLDDQIFSAVEALPMADLLQHKVSRGRIGKEFFKLVQQKRFDVGFEALHRMKLLRAIVVGDLASVRDTGLGEACVWRMRVLQGVLEKISKRPGESSHELHTLVLGALCTDVLQAHEAGSSEWLYQPYEANKFMSIGSQSKAFMRSPPWKLLHSVMRDNLDLSDRISKAVFAVLSGADFFRSHWVQLQLYDLRCIDEEAMAKVSPLRQKRSNQTQYEALLQQFLHVSRMTGSHFREAALIGALAVHSQKKSEETLKGRVVPAVSEEEDIRQVVELYDLFLAVNQRIWAPTRAQDESEARDMRHVLNGSDVKEITGAQGRDVQRVLDRLLLWQLQQKDASEEELAERALQWLREQSC